MLPVPSALTGNFIDRPFSASKSALVEMPVSASGDNPRARMGWGATAIDTRNLWGLQDVHPLTSGPHFSGGWHGDFPGKALSTRESCEVGGMHAETEQLSNFALGVDSERARLDATQAAGLDMTRRPESDCASLAGAFSPVTLVPPRDSWPREAPGETTFHHATGQNAPLPPGTEEGGRRGLAPDWGDHGRREGLTTAGSAGFKNRRTTANHQTPDVEWEEAEAREQESAWPEICDEKERTDTRQTRRRCGTGESVEDDGPHRLLLGRMDYNSPGADVAPEACAPQPEDLENETNASNSVEVRSIEYFGCPGLILCSAYSSLRHIFVRLPQIFAIPSLTYYDRRFTSC